MSVWYMVPWTPAIEAQGDYCWARADGGLLAIPACDGWIAVDKGNVLPGLSVTDGPTLSFDGWWNGYPGMSGSGWLLRWHNGAWHLYTASQARNGFPPLYYWDPAQGDFAGGESYVIASGVAPDGVFKATESDIGSAVSFAKYCDDTDTKTAHWVWPRRLLDDPAGNLGAGEYGTAKDSPSFQGFAIGLRRFEYRKYSPNRGRMARCYSNAERTAAGPAAKQGDGTWRVPSADEGILYWSCPRDILDDPADDEVFDFLPELDPDYEGEEDFTGWKYEFKCLGRQTPTSLDDFPMGKLLAADFGRWN